MTKGHEDTRDLLFNSTEIGIDKELSSRSFRDFVDISWREVEPSRPYIQNWHTDAICDHLQAVQEGQLKRLVINVPPGSMKSLSCAVFFPAWSWTKTPGKKFIFASYSDMISRRDSLRNRRLIESDWYRERWGDQFELHKDGKGAGKYTNDQGGFRMMTTVKGGVTGEHADVQVVDDPIKPLEVTKSTAVAKATLEEVKTWWSETMSSRLVDFKTSSRIIIMQRLHENDLAGVVLDGEEISDYEHLMLPMEFEPKRKCFTRIGFEDPRTKEGELLCPERFPREAVDNLKKELGSRGAGAQLQQNPTPADGAIILEEWFQYYKTTPTEFESVIQSWDCGFKKTDTSDYVVGQVWGVKDEKYYLLDQVRDRMSFVDTYKAIEALTKKWPEALTKLVEDKANGAAIVDVLKKKVIGLKLINPEGGKESRLQAVEPLWEAGAVFLPDPKIYKWVKGFREEVIGFPAKAHDDQVDSMSQALIYLHKKRIGRLRKAMSRV